MKPASTIIVLLFQFNMANDEKNIARPVEF